MCKNSLKPFFFKLESKQVADRAILIRLNEVSGHSGKIFDSKSCNPELIFIFEEPICKVLDFKNKYKILKYLHKNCKNIIQNIRN